KILHMMDLLYAAFDAMTLNCSKGYDGITNIDNAYAAEQAINDCRDSLRDEHMKNLENNAYDYRTGVYYMDIISECERVGDFMINVSEAIMDINEDK
ncbi:MAG: Na/Pi cotransporter family protein, partial [Bacteroidales bacterium]